MKSNIPSRWVCKKHLINNIDYLCESKDGRIGASLLDNGAVRVVKFDSSDIKIDGKKRKDRLGVDVS